MPHTNNLIIFPIFLCIEDIKYLCDGDYREVFVGVVLDGVRYKLKFVPTVLGTENLYWGKDRSLVKYIFMVR